MRGEWRWALWRWVFGSFDGRLGLVLMRLGGAGIHVVAAGVLWECGFLLWGLNENW